MVNVIRKDYQYIIKIQRKKLFNHIEGFSHSPFSSLLNHNVAVLFDLDKAVSDQPSRTTDWQF